MVGEVWKIMRDKASQFEDPHGTDKVHSFLTFSQGSQSTQCSQGSQGNQGGQGTSHI